jgi:hypothetical protein
MNHDTFTLFPCWTCPRLKLQHQNKYKNLKDGEQVWQDRRLCCLLAKTTCQPLHLLHHHLLLPTRWVYFFESSAALSTSCQTEGISNNSSWLKSRRQLVRTIAVKGEKSMQDNARLFHNCSSLTWPTLQWNAENGCLMSHAPKFHFCRFLLRSLDRLEPCRGKM